MIAQRKPNLDKGFKDLPLYFFGLFLACQRALVAFMRSLLARGRSFAGLTLVFANVARTMLHCRASLAQLAFDGNEHGA
jgi:hypothetical protein